MDQYSGLQVPQRPKAVLWYGVFCGSAAAMNLALFGLSLWFIVKHDELANEFLTAQVVLIAGLVCAPLALAMAFLNAWLGTAKNIKNAWQVHMSNIAVGIGTCFLTPLAVPLLIAWFHPDVRAWYAKPD